MTKNDDKTNEITIIIFLPYTSEIDAKIIIDIAKAPVVTDNDKLAVAGDTLNSSDNNGKIGCVLYKIANVINAPKNSIQLAIRNVFVPFSIYFTNKAPS